jgi:hypothetical protein
MARFVPADIGEAGPLRTNPMTRLVATQNTIRLRPESRSDDPAREDELESARAEILRLRQQLGEPERLQRDISEVLDGLGLRFDVG